MCAPASAARTASCGPLMLAAIILVSIECILNIDAIVSISAVPFDEISSILPTNGLTYDAPAFAARRACMGLKIKVTFVLIPFDDNTLTAFNPSVVIGIFITILLLIFASSNRIDLQVLSISFQFSLSLFHHSFFLFHCTLIIKDK